MYLSFYDLNRKPFQISADPVFLWMGEKHKEALAMLKYGILDNRGFVMLTGNVGTGKTTLIHALVNSLGANVISATITDPGLTGLDFYNYLADAFELGGSFSGKGEFLTAFRHFLTKSYREGKQVLLIIDEAQHLGAGMLEEIRLLSNIERQDTKLLNIFLVGQDELNEILERYENRPLRQRMTLQYHLEALTGVEVEDMIRFRLKVAGTEKRIFADAAMREIHAFSKGYPRLINIICDQAMLSGYVAQKRTIDAAMIRDCVADLKFPTPSIPAPPEAAILAGPAPMPERRKTRSGWTFVRILLLLILLAGAFYFPLRAGTPLPGIPGYWVGQVQRFLAALVSMEKMPSDIHRVVNKVPVPVAEPTRGQAVSESKSPVKETSAPPKEAPAPAAPSVIPSVQSPAPSASAPPAAQLPRLPAEKRFVLVFGYNSNEIPSDGYDRLNQTVAAMDANPGVTVTVRGFTDNVGTPAYNAMLSKFRADIVKTYLVSKGISPARITSVGKGHENPIENNTSIEGRRANRRVEVELSEEPKL